MHALADGKGFVKDGVEYREGDYLYLAPDVFDQLEDAAPERELPEYLANSRFHKVGARWLAFLGEVGAG